MCGPTVIHHGSDDQRSRYLERLLRCDDIWCQLFSEPASGSDLAGLRTKAVREGDSWRVNGQKVWTTLAQYAEYGILLTRTDTLMEFHKSTHFLGHSGLEVICYVVVWALQLLIIQRCCRWPGALAAERHLHLRLAGNKLELDDQVCLLAVHPATELAPAFEGRLHALTRVELEIVLELVLRASTLRRRKRQRQGERDSSEVQRAESRHADHCCCCC